MTSKELRTIAIESCRAELDRYDKLMVAAAKKGELFVIVEKVTSAARCELLLNGFEVKVMMEPGKEIGKSNQWKIAFEK